MKSIFDPHLLVYNFWNLQNLQSDKCHLYADGMMNGWQSLDRFGMGAGHQKNQGGITGLELSALHPNYQGGDMVVLKDMLITNGQWFNKLCLWNVAFIENPKELDLGNFKIAERVDIPKGWHTRRIMESPNSFLHTFLYASLHLYLL